MDAHSRVRTLEVAPADQPRRETLRRETTHEAQKQVASECSDHAHMHWHGACAPSAARGCGMGRTRHRAAALRSPPFLTTSARLQAHRGHSFSFGRGCVSLYTDSSSLGPSFSSGRECVSLY